VIVLRIDFNSEIGLGHLKRQETFIKKWRMENGEWRIICKECDKNLTKLPVIKIKDEKEFFEKVKKLNPKEVIVDNYNFTIEYEKKFKELFPNIKLTIFDDEYKEHFCDEIINHNLNARKEKYKNPEIVKIIKPLISEEFKKYKKRRFRKKGIFISFGATDAKGIGLRVLKELKKTKPFVNFYTTSANKNLNKLKRFCRINKWCKLHIDKNIAIGMAKSKFAIITPSTICYEAMYMNLNFIAIKVAGNQEGLAMYLKSKRIKVLNIREIYKLRDLKWRD